MVACKKREQAVSEKKRKNFSSHFKAKEWLSNGSGMNREIHVPLRESLKVKFLGLLNHFGPPKFYLHAMLCSIQSHLLLSYSFIIVVVEQILLTPFASRFSFS